MTTTILSIDGDRFHINGAPTYSGRRWRGSRIEGLLFNSRMANAVVDDENPATRGAWSYADGDWSAERNTRELIAALPDYRRHGLLAIALNLSGGSPQGYSWHQPWHICGFTADGQLKPDYAARLGALVAAADAQGMALILGLFYGRQSQRLRDEDAVRAAVAGTVDWLVGRGARNVLLEIGNEVDLPVFAHPVIGAERCHELIGLAQARSAGHLATPSGRLLVGTSLVGPAAPPDSILACADILLPHGNRIDTPDGIRLHVLRTRTGAGYRGQPITFNEDDHYAFDAADNNMLAAIDSGAGWGFFDYRRIRERFEDGFQSLPVDWSTGSARKRAFFGLLKEVTGL
ncbi:hypothetical protein FHP25_26195 [Vineibacter terrae]|uniref:Glycoside hydrolase family 5 domain-containing protein n=1 Tax=Vineibacter terrae TaxID=2586908 RepID=A0A5C8PGL6_9HYPH|nr:hypothetical protein [Vineibacter terrae]TXL72323.1 hypothetical protein FHP25_26195 [Vineibacter terrae]